MKIPKEILKKYEVWKQIVYHSGVDGLKEIKGFNDEPLKGNWKGHRSSRLNNKYRVIYKEEKGLLKIYVLDVNSHDYKRVK